MSCKIGEAIRHPLTFTLNPKRIPNRGSCYITAGETLANELRCLGVSFKQKMFLLTMNKLDAP